MDILPNHLIGKICSLTDDDTIFNFGCSSKLNNEIVQNSKDSIKHQRDNEPTYELNVLKEYIPNFSPFPYNIHNFENLNVVSNYIGENIESIQHKLHVSSPDTEKRYITYYFNADLLANDLLTSVKVKGDIYKLSFQLATTRSYIDNMTDGFMKILPVDNQGYTEILNYFLPYIYFKLFPFSEIILKIQHCGDIDINMSFVNFSKHHNEIIANLTYRRYNTIFTYAVIPEMLYSNLPYNTRNNFVLFNVYPCFISKGIALIIKQDDNIINKPQEIIKDIKIDLYNKQSPLVISHSYHLNSRRLYSHNVKKNKLYNLNFELNDCCLYIPLENINFNYVSQTTITLRFHEECETKYSHQGCIDVVYFSKNMIRNKDGFGSRYYW